MIMRLEILTPAKINLYLDVLDRMENGYHNIESVMQSVSLYDKITLEIDTEAEPSCSILSNDASIPLDKTNLVYRAYLRFLEKTGITSPKCVFHIEKSIPIAAGMAGGSADGAGALILLNRAFGSPLTSDELLALGARLGADIPFCLTQGTAICKGIGDKITPLPSLKDVYIVSAIDNSSVSTPEAFSMLDSRFGLNSTPHGKLDAICEAIALNDLHKLSSLLYNKFESVIEESNESVTKIKAVMRDSGALGALMSGSGPSVFGIFENEESQMRALSSLLALGIRAYACKTV